eukprot:TRINITY_DN4735_c1_g1_i13.p1 TRINITY_DN4735_c1_g1~~TRINITY_DN4735_c1_g1_i13.p1  ORF type:complete len:187 (+),score=-23.38 TRINITY_DN4735_c1_g1_i13:393-953(+)
MLQVVFIILFLVAVVVAKSYFIWCLACFQQCFQQKDVSILLLRTVKISCLYFFVKFIYIYTGIFMMNFSRSKCVGIGLCRWLHFQYSQCIIILQHLEIFMMFEMKQTCVTDSVLSLTLSNQITIFNRTTSKIIRNNVEFFYDMRCGRQNTVIFSYRCYRLQNCKIKHALLQVQYDRFFISSAFMGN